MSELTIGEHRARHVELHNNLDELLADYIMINSDSGLLDRSVMDLLKWSHEQTLNPTGRGDLEPHNDMEEEA